MTNKKLWLSLLAIVLIVCMLSVALVSCKKKDKEPEVSKEEQALTAIINGVQKSVQAGEMTDLNIAADLTLKVNDTEYGIDLDLDLDLLQYDGWTNYSKATAYQAGETYYKLNKDGSYAKVGSISQEKFNANKDKDFCYFTRSKANKETATKSNTFLNAKVTKDDATILGVYYQDAKSELGIDYSDGLSDEEKNTIYQGNMIFVEYQEQGKQGLTRIKFPAAYVNATMQALGASVDFSDINLYDNDIWGKIKGFIPMIAAFTTNGQISADKASVTLDLSALLDTSDPDSVGSILLGFQETIDALGIDLDMSDIKNILPEIALTISATLSNEMVTGVELAVGIKEKDLNIKTKTPANHELLNVNMTKDLNLSVGLDYTFGGAENTFNFSGAATSSAWKAQNNLLDISLGATLAVGSDITVKLTDTISLNVPAGTYDLTIAAAMNPFGLLAVDFDFSSIAGAISTIEDILQYLAGAEITLFHNETETDVLSLVIGEKYEAGVKQDGVFATVTTSLLSGYTLPTISGMSLTDLIPTVKGIVTNFVDPDDVDYQPAEDLVEIQEDGEEEEEEEAAEEEEEEEVDPIMYEIAKYLARAYIGINDGKTGHRSIFAEFLGITGGELLIPFDGYTEFKGAYNSAYTYYTKTAGGMVLSEDTQYSASKTYYEKIPAHYVNANITSANDMNPLTKYYENTGSTESPVYEYVGKNPTYDSGKTYYYMVKDGYEAKTFASATDWAAGTYYEYKEDTYTKVTTDISSTFADGTYYVKGKNHKDGDGTFGVSLDASLNVGKVNNKLAIDINATVNHMDVFGLPASFSATINNLSIKLWENNYPILNGSTKGHYQDVA